MQMCSCVRQSVFSIKVGSFKATSFEELFEATKSLRWEEYIPRNGKFWVAKAASIKSKLFSPSDIQSIMKKRWYADFRSIMASNGSRRMEHLTRYVYF